MHVYATFLCATTVGDAKGHRLCVESFCEASAVWVLYRRAKAHLALDEHDRASEDLTLALSQPMDKLIVSELEKLRKQKGSALQVVGR